MSMTRLEEIAQRLAKVDRDWQMKSDWDRQDMLVIITNVDGEYIDGVLHNTFDVVCDIPDEKNGLHTANFIAHAPADISYLLEAVASARREALLECDKIVEAQEAVCNERLKVADYRKEANHEALGAIEACVDIHAAIRALIERKG